MDFNLRARSGAFFSLKPTCRRRSHIGKDEDRLPRPNELGQFRVSRTPYSLGGYGFRRIGETLLPREISSPLGLRDPAFRPSPREISRERRVAPRSGKADAANGRAPGVARRATATKTLQAFQRKGQVRAACSRRRMQLVDDHKPAVAQMGGITFLREHHGRDFTGWCEKMAGRWRNSHVPTAACRPYAGEPQFFSSTIPMMGARRFFPRS